MDPAVAYARTSDGVRIAWTSSGAGPPLLLLPGMPFSNFVGDWRIPAVRAAYEQLGRSVRLIQYDARGGGQSERDVTDLSLEPLLLDLDAVLDAAGVARTALLGFYLSATPAMAYAARRPERVSHLVLFGATARPLAALKSAPSSAVLTLLERDWDVFVESAAHQWLGWSAGESGRLEAESLRTSTTPAVAVATMRAAAEMDISNEFSSIAAPALVLHREHAPQIPLEESQRLAAALPKGRLQVLPGESAALFFERAAESVDVILDFLGVRQGLPSTADGADTAGLTARELEVLRLVAQGESNGEIARRLGLSIHTVERHVANLYRKIDARGRADATAYAVRRGLV